MEFQDIRSNYKKQKLFCVVVENNKVVLFASEFKRDLVRKMGKHNSVSMLKYRKT